MTLVPLVRRVLIKFSSINHVMLFAWVRGKGHMISGQSLTGILNIPTPGRTHDFVEREYNIFVSQVLHKRTDYY